jgi:CelD/BcsL family acetyltransferase involved in cellulose biosynthesis
VKVIPPGEWESLVPEWERLLAGATEPNIFLSPGWVISWWRHFGDNCQPLLVTGWNHEGRLCALAPFYLRRQSGLGVLGGGFATLGLLGDLGVGSEYLGLLIAAGQESHFLRALQDCMKGRWALADLHGIKTESVTGRHLLEVLAARAERMYRECEPCSAILLPNDYENYLASLEQKFRSTVRYRTNKLTKNFHVRLLRTRVPEEVEPHLETLFALHQARWVAEGHAGSFQSQRKRAFYSDVTRDFLARGWLRFYHLEVDGVIRASQFGFAMDSTLYSLQEAFDHEFHPPGVGGIGIVLRGMVIKECIAEGIKCYDFLGGEEDFKTRWKTTTHYVERVRMGAPGWRGALAFAQVSNSVKARRIIKQRSPSWLLHIMNGILLRPQPRYSKVGTERPSP